MTAAAGGATMTDDGRALAAAEETIEAAVAAIADGTTVREEAEVAVTVTVEVTVEAAEETNARKI